MLQVKAATIYAVEFIDVARLGIDGNVPVIYDTYEDFAPFTEIRFI